MAAAMAACGGPGPVAIGPGGNSAHSAGAGQSPAPSGIHAATSPSAAPSASPAVQQSVNIFFTAGAKLAPEEDQVSGANPPRDALQLLLRGPKESNLYSDIPQSVQLQSVAVKDGTAFVSFDSSFFSSGGATGTQLRLAQVVYTLTQFSGLTRVQFLQDGKPATVAGGEGFPLNRPLTRQSFPSLQPRQLG